MTTLTEKLQKNTNFYADKPAIIFKDIVITYEKLAYTFSQIRSWIKEENIGINQVAFIFLPQRPDTITWFFGLMSAGLIPAFMPLPSIKQDEKKYWESHQKLIELTKPSVVITTSEWTEAFENIINIDNCRVYANHVLKDRNIEENNSLCNNEIAFLQHSSGTTGLKKGVALSHKAVIKQINSYTQAIKATDNDVVVSWLPMYHDMGLIACTITPLIMGQTIVLLDPFEWVTKPITLFEQITKYKGSLVWLPNFSFEHLRRTIRPSKFEGLDLTSVRAFINCSEPCKAETFDRFENHFSKLGVTSSQLQVCYAMAETVYAVTQTRVGKQVDRIWVDKEALLDNKVIETEQGHGVAILSCGEVINDCFVEILDPNTRQAVTQDQVGEVVISGEFLFNGYYHRLDKTSEVYDGKRYFTRDLGFFIENQLYLLGRKDDLIISNGRNYFAHEIEQYVNTLDGIKPGRNVAIGVYNDTIGSNEIYLIQEKSTTDSLSKEEEKSLIKLIRNSVQEYMGVLLRDVIIVDPSWLHKSSSGKISRKLNKDKLLNYLQN